MPEEPSGEGEGDGGDEEHGEEVRGDFRKARAFKVDAADGFDSEAHGVGVGEVLERLGHVVNGGNDTGKKRQRQKKDKDVDENLLHIVGDGGDDETDPGGAYGKDEKRQVKKRQRAGEGDAEPEAGDEKEGGALENTDERRGKRLADENFGGRQRRDEELVEGAQLALASDGEPRQHDDLGEADHANEPGEKVPAGFLVGIVPGAGQKLYRGRGAGGVPGGDDTADIAGGEACGHGIAPVGDELEGTLFAPRQFFREVGGKDDDEHGVAAVDGVGDLRLILKQPGAL